LHLDKFHLNSPIFSAMVAAYLWLAIYIVVPVAMLILLIYQIRLKGSTPKRKATIANWMRFALATQGTIMAVTGVILFVSPATASTFWPWALTPLTSLAIGAWLIGVGVIALHMTWENDHQRNKIAYISYAVLGILQAASLVRYAGEVNWSTASSWIYLIFVVCIIPTGLYGWKASRQTKIG
jgi:hypothetical protein